MSIDHMGCYEVFAGLRKKTEKYRAALAAIVGEVAAYKSRIYAPEFRDRSAQPEGTVYRVDDIAREALAEEEK